MTDHGGSNDSAQQEGAPSGLRGGVVSVAEPDEQRRRTWWIGGVSAMAVVLVGLGVLVASRGTSSTGVAVDGATVIPSSSDTTANDSRAVGAPQAQGTTTTLLRAPPIPLPTDEPGPNGRIDSPMDALSDQASAAFGDRFGGLSWDDGVAVHVKDDGQPAPAEFNGYPVRRSRYSWAELDAARHRVGTAFYDLRGKGFAINSFGIRPDLTVGITIDSTDPAVHQALLTELGPGPWKVDHGGPYRASPKLGDG